MNHEFEGSVRLPDGRALSYRESGQPRGKPVLLFHGFPGSRYLCPDAAVARDTNVRLIVPERPGFGLSDPRPGWQSLTEWAGDVAVLADALDLPRFAVAGYSLGGAFAAASAHEFPDRITRLGLIGSIAPLDLAANWEGWGNVRGFFELARDDASALRRVAEPFTLSAEVFVAELADAACEADKRLLEAPEFRAQWLRDARETLRPGMDSPLQELIVAARPWGFDLKRVRVPAFVWHGLADLNIPPAMARYLSSMIPDCRARFYPGEGHFVLFTHWREILSALVD